MSDITDIYLTISQPSEGIYKEKGSKFIAYAHPVRNEDEIKEHLANLRKEHHTARHHCYAWKLGMDDNYWRANDDGEPGNSAGKPIHGQILSKSLTNVLIVVVRYFGGTKLGVGGLMTAYKSAAENALNHATIVEKQLMAHHLVSFDYSAMNEVMSCLKNLEAEQYEQEFALQCQLKASIALGKAEILTEQLSKISGVEVKWLHTY
jgi:uncharacterized YigZ family protein